MQRLCPRISSSERPATLTACLLSLVAFLLFVGVAPAAASRHAHAKISLAAHERRSGGHSHPKRRAARAAIGSATRIGAGSVVNPPSGALPLFESGFEQGLQGWNTAGVGEVLPEVTSAIARTGSKSCRVVLSGNQNRSELILGGNGGASTTGALEFHEGDEYWYGFSVDIQQMVYGKPGAHNIIMQFKSEGEGSPNFALDLWNYEGDGGMYANTPTKGKGLWSEGDAMGGNRFLAPISEQAWHDIQIHFKASSVGAGFYEVFLDGALIDARSGVSMIVPGHAAAYIKDGLYRNGTTAPGTSEIFLDSAKLGTSLAAVQPG